jgi:quinol monooxygenase YgiN
MTSLPVLVALAGVLVAAVAAGMLAGRCVREPRVWCVVWLVAILGLLIALAAAAKGLASGFGPITFRGLEVGAQLLAPLWLAWGLVELVARSEAVRFGTRLAGGALTVVAGLILTTDTLSAQPFSKAWPVASQHYQQVSHGVLIGVQVVAVVAAVSTACVAVARSRSPSVSSAMPRGQPGALIGVVAVSLAVLATVALRFSLPARSADPLVATLAAGLVWFGLTRDLEAADVPGTDNRSRAASRSRHRGRNVDNDQYVRGDHRDAGERADGGDRGMTSRHGRPERYGPPGSPQRPSYGSEGYGREPAPNQGQNPGRSGNGWGGPGGSPGYPGAPMAAPMPGARPGTEQSPGATTAGGERPGVAAPGGGVPGAGAAGAAAAGAPMADAGRAGSAGRPYGRILIFTLLDDKAVDFDRLAEQTAEEVRLGEPDTLVYVIHLVPNAPMQRIFYEIYRDRAAFDSHESKSYMKRFVRERRACVLATNVIELRLKYAKVAPLPLPQEQRPPAQQLAPLPAPPTAASATRPQLPPGRPAQRPDIQRPDIQRPDAQRPDTAHRPEVTHRPDAPGTQRPDAPGTQRPNGGGRGRAGTGGRGPGGQGGQYPPPADPGYGRG